MSNLDVEFDNLDLMWKHKMGETEGSYDRRKDHRTDAQFSDSMAKGFKIEKYSAERFVETLEKYSPYKVLSYKILITPEVYKEGSFRDDGDLSVDFEVDGKLKTIVFDIKAVPPITNAGTSTEHNNRFRINMDSHHGMIKKGHIGIPMVDTTYKGERINILDSSALEDIESRFTTYSYPKIGSYENPGGRDKHFYDVEIADQVFDIPWFSMNDTSPSGDSIENFQKMIRRAVE